MENNNLLHIQNTLKSNQILITFSGKLTQGLIEELGEAVRKYLETEDRPQKEIFNVFSIFIEQTQNIKNYCFTKENTESYETISGSCIVTIGKLDDGQNYILSGNLLEKNDIKPLVDKIDHLIPLNNVELKKLYKEALKKDISLTNNSSAGLGLIDMARKASQPLEYSIIDVDQNYSFFTLKAVI
ncbi:SiaB family protein kinase [Bacillus sp. Marseille-P3661]|uniref:SiaB family protein kinase n=1 Tax=Bacillus sp. Marseille-P3661 TaxID=1936234 RepID=UPI000C859F88|nr:SiaB family protein kinase [Bacillus sp. Marseille-P3661]